MLPALQLTVVEAVVFPLAAALTHACPDVIFKLPEYGEEKEVPEVPVEPEVPEEPTPEVPEVPVEPEVPEEPATPEVPEEPATPEVPEEPEVPLVPELPEVPEVPRVPFNTKEHTYISFVSQAPCAYNTLHVTLYWPPFPGSE